MTEDETSHSKKVDQEVVDKYIEYLEQKKFVDEQIELLKDFFRKSIQSTIGTGKVVYNEKIEASRWGG